MSLSFLMMAAWFSVAFAPVDQTAIQGNVMVRGKVLYTGMWRGARGALVFENRGIEDALVTATSSSMVETTTTDAHGNFFFLTLLPGNYEFSARAPGFMDRCSVRPPDRLYELDAGYEYMASIFLFNECK